MVAILIDKICDQIFSQLFGLGTKKIIDNENLKKVEREYKKDLQLLLEQYQTHAVYNDLDRFMASTTVANSAVAFCTNCDDKVKLTDDDWINESVNVFTLQYNSNPVIASAMKEFLLKLLNLTKKHFLAVDSKTRYIVYFVIQSRNEMFNRIDDVEDRLKILHKSISANSEHIAQILDILRTPASAILTNEMLDSKDSDFFEQHNILFSMRRFVERNFLKSRFHNCKNLQSLIDMYADLLRSFVKINLDNRDIKLPCNVFEATYKIIIEIDSTFPIKIIGNPGTGKSTYLSILFLYLFGKIKENACKYIPIYFDLHYYLSLGSFDSIERQFKMDINIITEISNIYSSSYIVVIVDSVEDNARCKVNMLSLLNNQLNKINNHKRLVCIGALTQSEKSHLPKLFKERSPAVINFISCDVSDSCKHISIIKTYSKIYGVPYAFFLTVFEKCGIYEFDLNTLTLIRDYYSLHNEDDEDELSSLTDLYYHYCIGILEDDEKSLSETAKLAFNYHMTQKQTTNFNERSWDLIHKSIGVRNYLIAYNYAQRIVDDKRGNEDGFFEIIYTDDITYFMKQIICTGKYNHEDEYYQSIMQLYPKASNKAKSQFCYLLGRFKTDVIRRQATEFLREQKNQLSPKAKNKNKSHGSTYKLPENRLLERTVFVSLMYLNESIERDEYIELLLENTNVNSYNRGFHLQYYGSLDYSPTEISFLQRDDAKVNKIFEQTFNALEKRILNVVDNKKEDTLFELNVLTLCSIVQIRSQSSALSKKYISKTKDIIRKVVESHPPANKKMLAYLIMMDEDLDECFEPGSLIKWADRLRPIKRQGWIDDNIPESETVIEHIFSCWLIGFMYLPATTPKGNQYKGYSKKDILDMLLIHDLAEIDTNDIVARKKTDKDKEKEHLRFLVFLMHDTYFTDIDNSHYRKLWDAYHSKKNINGEIASDIDIIQAYYRYRTYKREGHFFTPEREQEWEQESGRVSTDIGKEILKKILTKI